MTQIDPNNVRMEASWKAALYPCFSQEYFVRIKQALIDAKAQGKIVYPPNKLIFNAFEQTPFAQVKIVILGQDPYHGAGQAMGLSFSVPQGIAVPASLKNIYKELSMEYPDYRIPTHGDLRYWAQQGVLLLNASLTVLAGQASSHSQIGWLEFTDDIIRILNAQHSGLVFMLWGNFAKSKATLIDADKHCILSAAHPSPLARGAFFGCNHFRLANQYLTQQGKTAIDWQIK